MNKTTTEPYVNHHTCNKTYIGSSDIASVYITGSKDGNTVINEIHFGGDDSYHAYMADETVIIPDYYRLVADVEGPATITDDYESFAIENKGPIRVYRAGEMGCIIQTVGKAVYSGWKSVEPFSAKNAFKENLNR